MAQEKVFLEPARIILEFGPAERSETGSHWATGAVLAPSIMSFNAIIQLYQQQPIPIIDTMAMGIG